MSRAEAFEARIAELERRLLQLRHELEPVPEGMPDSPRDVLEARVDDEHYLLPVEPIRQVLPVMWTSTLPDAPPWVRGTFAYGEKVVPLIDLRQRLHGHRRDVAPTDVVVLVEDGEWFGLLADAVLGVHRAHPAELARPAPGIPHAPFLVATRSDAEGGIAHLLSLSRIRRELLLDDR